MAIYLGSLSYVVVDRLVSRPESASTVVVTWEAPQSFSISNRLGLRYDAGFASATPNQTTRPAHKFRVALVYLCKCVKLLCVGN